MMKTRVAGAAAAVATAIALHQYLTISNALAESAPPPAKAASQAKPANPVKPAVQPAKRSQTPMSSAEVVKGFFSAFGKGDVNGVVDSFHPEAMIYAVRKSERKGNHWGSYTGKEGAKSFISALGNLFETKAFTVNHVVGEGNVAFADGTFTHKVKSTGKLFSSEWALKCLVKDNKIVEYTFYEDSAAFNDASH
ncbi:MAG: nuclear transport factor 2 family protein [Myxococcota bacterium]